MTQLNKNENGLSKGSLKEVAHIAWPLVISMLSYTAMGVADTLFVGWLGVSHLAAVGVATTVIFTINAFFFGAIHGIKVYVSQATGAELHTKAIRIAWLGILLAVPLGLIVIAGGGFDAFIFGIMGGSEQVQSFGRLYFSIRVLGAPIFYVYLSISDFYQGTGDTKTPMKISLLVNGLNVIFDLVLIFGIGSIPGLGIAGAAWATVLAILVGTILILVKFLRQYGWVGRLRVEELKTLVKLGFPIGMRYLLEIGAFAFFTAIVSRMGTAEMAANQIAIKIASIGFLPGHGIAEAAGVLTGRYVGAKDVPSARRSHKSALKISLVVMTSFGVIFWLFSEPLIHIFQEDPEVVRIGTQLLIIASFFQIFDAFLMTASGSLNGTGDTKFTMYASILGSWFVLVPLAYLLGITLDLGVQGVWVASLIEVLVISTILHRRFVSSKWEDKGVIS